MRTLGFLLMFTLVAAPLGDAAAQRKGRRGANAGSGALTGTNPAEAAAAAKALGASKSPRALNQLLDALAMGVHPRVAAAALDALAAHKKPVSFDTIRVYLRHRSPKVRASAVRAMGALGDKRATRHVLAALRDGHRSVRAVAAELVAKKKLKRGIKALIVLLKKGDEAAAPALGSLANPDLARKLGELIGTAPDALLARALGTALLRPDFKPEEARVQVVRTLGKIPGAEALEQLTNYVGSVPEKPPRQSRREAEAIIEQRLGGG